MKRTPSNLKAEISSLLNLLITADIATVIQPVVVKDVSKGITRVTWAGEAPGFAYRGKFTTISDYKVWLDHSAYSAVLFDGSIIQLSYDFDGHWVCKHRLGFYPCPFNIDLSTLSEKYSILDVIDSLETANTADILLRSPLRFDYDGRSAGVDHPAVHFTFLSTDCRLPVVAPLSPGHFCQFVFKNFYPALWKHHSFIREWPRKLGQRTITEDDAKFLHLSCQR